MNHEEIIIVHENFLARTMSGHPPPKKKGTGASVLAHLQGQHTKSEKMIPRMTSVIVLVEFTFQTSVKSLDIIRCCEKCERQDNMTLN